MRVPIAHELPKEEVRRRLSDHSHEIAEVVPGGMADVAVSWANEDTMNVDVTTMGQTLKSRVLVEDKQVVFEVDIPLALSFVEPMIKGAIKSKGEKLLAPPKA
ncbi:hypothetical protein GRI42_13520 [Erythrobacter gaetbuli]|uniref:Polyhydroxyalkanoic acid synthase n=1 Tax=Qipengyuania gaetbuli TaxID=266952 RepID=A0A844Y4J9_9SPHN|nr:polyhydroxyalkanoic acid system family protein [Qipengyuania gaetbuli]MXO52327.1 hypothetical protein [Qipengyuania gaetbuli]